MAAPTIEDLPLRTGGDFLLTEPGERPAFIPEGFNETHRDIRDAAETFMKGEILPIDEDLEKDNPSLHKKMVKAACEFGLSSVEVPEEFGGLGLDKVAANLVVEAMAGQPSFNVSLGAHNSIGMLPVVYFGTPELKAEYLPKMCAGELISCYALTEPGSGSDALAARTKAVLSDDGSHYLLNGSKLYISNAAFADTAVVFAKVDGAKFTGFLVDMHAEGVEVGPPEHKMGIRGSATSAIHFDNVKVPADHVLGEVGRGHVIAFNILNMGRLKLAAGTLGGAKNVFAKTLKYAGERSQFETLLRDFPAMRDKFAAMAVGIYASESIIYRTAGDIDRALLEHVNTPPEDDFKAIEEFAAEAAICKVFASEAGGLAADEAVQIHGGYGYMEEYGIERAYRDTRINRIFEGTNEINRMLVPGTLLRRAMKGQLNLMAAAGPINNELEDEGYAPPEFDGALGHERTMLHLMKRRTLYTTNAAVMKLQQDLEKRQQVLMALADMIIDIYAADSGLARALELDADETTHPGAFMATRIFVREAWDRVDTQARRVLFHIASDKGKAVHRKNLGKWDLLPELDVLGAKQDYAAWLIEKDGYAV